jgi:uncharacterized metal-binding protein
MAEEKLSCVDCAIKACRGKGGEYPAFCPTRHLDPQLLEEAMDKLRGEDNPIAIASCLNEFDSYGVRSRVEETMHLAKLMGAKKLGIAACAGLLTEARTLARVLRAQGWEVYGVCCKCGAQPKSALGFLGEKEETSSNMCNPVLQALVLNREKTDLNIAVGLCAGHDSLFYKYSEAYVTTVVTKDRLLGHNSVAPLYLLDGYWKRLLQREEFLAPEELPETF